MKNSFVIMDSWAVILEGMPEHTTSEVIKMICRYQMSGEVVRSDDAGANALFDAWKPTIDENNASYESRVNGAKKARDKKNVDINSDNSNIKVDIKTHQDSIKDDIKVDINSDDGLISMGDSDSVNDTVSPKGYIYILSSAEAIRQIIDYLNTKTDKHFSPKTKETQKTINARLKEGYTVDDFKRVIDNKVQDWSGGDMEQYLRPSTLFRPSNFEAYLNQKPRPSNKPTDTGGKVNPFQSYEQRTDYDFEALERMMTR